MAEAVWQQWQVAAAGRSRPGGVNQRDARVFVRVRWAGVLAFAAISEVGVGGRRVEIGHGFFREPPLSLTMYWIHITIHVSWTLHDDTSRYNQDT